MHRFIWLVAALLFLPLGACGGGSDSGPGVGSLSAVKGVVASRDGATDDLAGVLVTCRETGDMDVTDALGAFDLDVPEGERFHLEFEDRDAPSPKERDHGKEHDEDDETEDPGADGTDIAGDEVEIEALDEDEECEVEVDLEDGEVKEARVRRRNRDGKEERESEGKLDREEGIDEEEAEGEFEIEEGDRCAGIEIEIEGFSGPTELEVWLVNAQGAEALLGSISIALAGKGHLEVTFCGGDELPFDAASIKDLAGTKVEVYDEDANLVFQGRIPGFACDDDDDDDDDDEKESDDDDEEEKEEKDGESSPEKDKTPPESDAK